jgi:N-acetylglucosaminyldiphosphoundecaprenol N-acetyl-beta-D-mannosaminyltransferase
MIQDYFKRIFTGTAKAFCEKAEKAMLSGERMFVVTANPEILMNGQRREEINSLLLSPDAVIVPDGISVVRAMRTCGIDAKERITGVDLAAHLLEAAGREEKTIYLLGAKEEVVSTLAKKMKEKYPKATVLYQNGYSKDKDQDFEKILEAKPDLVLVALGVPAQELLIAKHLHKFDKGVFIGVGGSFDVLSGSKRRAPAFFVKTNTEWLYRIMREPSRLGRFYQNNVKFLSQVKKAAKGK